MTDDFKSSLNTKMDEQKELCKEKTIFYQLLDQLNILVNKFSSMFLSRPILILDVVQSVHNHI